MDIASLSVSMSQAKLASNVSVSLAKLAMDSVSEDFQDLTKMMELSVNPNIGSNFDESV